MARYLYFGDRTSITVKRHGNLYAMALVNGAMVHLPPEMPYVQRLVEHGQLIPQVEPPKQFSLIEGAD